MKRIRSLMQPNVIRAIIYSSVSKLLIALLALFLWNHFINAGSISPRGIVDTGFFALALCFAIGAWIQYLSLDGMRPFRALRDKKKEPSLTAWAEEELEEDELTAVKFCSDFLLMLIFLIPSLVASCL